MIKQKQRVQNILAVKLSLYYAGLDIRSVVSLISMDFRVLDSNT